MQSKSSQSKFINLVHDNTDNKKLIGRSPLCLPNDHIIFVDDASQGAVFDGKAVAYDYTGSAFKPVETNPNTHTHTHTHTEFRRGTLMFSHPPGSVFMICAVRNISLLG